VIFAQALRALMYCHNIGIAHRDVKLANLMFSDAGSTHYGLKLIDFGSGHAFRRSVKEGDKPMKSIQGTPYFLAPELAQKRPYTERCDSWSLGIVFFMLLCGKAPFRGSTDEDTLQAAVKQKVDFDDHFCFSAVSDECKRMILKLLRKEPAKRYTIQHCLEKTLIHGLRKKHHVKKYGEMIVESMKEYQTLPAMTQLAIDAVSFTLPPSALRPLTDAFLECDAHAGAFGMITACDFSFSFAPYIGTPSEVKALFKTIDRNGTGLITYTQFIAVSARSLSKKHLNGKGLLSKSRLHDAFERIACNGSGRIDTKDLLLLTSGPQTNKLEKQLRAHGVFDRGLKFDDFLELISGKRKGSVSKARAPSSSTATTQQQLQLPPPTVANNTSIATDASTPSAPPVAVTSDSTPVAIMSSSSAPPVAVASSSSAPPVVSATSSSAPPFPSV